MQEMENEKWTVISQNPVLRQYEISKTNQHLLITINPDGLVAEILEWNEGCSQCRITDS